MDIQRKNILDMKLANGEVSKEEHQKQITLLRQKSLEDASTDINEVYTYYENTVVNKQDDAATEVLLHKEPDSNDLLRKTIQSVSLVQKHLQKIDTYILSLDQRLRNIEKKLFIETKEVTPDKAPVSKKEVTPDKIPVSAKKQIGKYIIKKILGEGGFSTVYLAIDTESNEEVAIKLLKLNELSEKVNRSQLMNEFIREADVMMKMEHACIAKFKEAGNYQNSPYLVMEYIEGPTIFQLIQDKKINVRQCLIIANAIATVLKYGYDNYQLIHRDIKPGNIIFSSQEGIFKLLDFGLAKCLGDAHHQLSMSLTRKGTAFYMSPEQVQNSSKVDFRADIYALGCSMYFILTGFQPYKNYESEGYSRVLQAISKDEVIPISQIKADIPDFVVKIVEKAMAHNKEKRYQSYDEFKTALKQVINLC